MTDNDKTLAAVKQQILVQSSVFKSTDRRYIDVPDEQAGKLSLRELYDLTGLPETSLANTKFIVDDEFVTDLQVVPRRESQLAIRTLPEGENAGKIALGVVGALIFVGGAALTFAVGGWALVVGLPLMALGTFVLGEALMPDMRGDMPNRDIYGGSSSTGKWSSVPVIYGKAFIAPDFAAYDYTSTKPKSNGKAKQKDLYLHQLYVLGQNPLVVDEIKLGDDYLYHRKHDTITATLSRVNANTATLNVSSGASALSGYRAGGRVVIQGFACAQNNVEYKISNVTATTMTLTGVDVVAENTPTSIDISQLVSSGIYYDVDINIIDDGKFENTVYPRLASEQYINRELKPASGSQSYVYITTPPRTLSTKAIIVCPQGLYALNSSGEKKSASQTAVIQFRPVESETFITGTYWFAEFSGFATADQLTEEATFVFPVQGQPGYSESGQYVLRAYSTRADLKPDSDGKSTGTNKIAIQRLINTRYTVDGDNTHNLKPVGDDIATDYVFLALKIRATDQLSSSISNLSCVLRPKIMGYDSGIDAWVPTLTSNPAAIYVDTLTNPVLNKYPIFTYRGVGYSQAQNLAAAWQDRHEYIPINWDTVEEWHEFCNDVGYECNGVSMDRSTVRDEVEKISSTGRAAATILDGEYTVIIDQERTAPVQLFTPRNSHGFELKRSFEPPPDGVKLKFTDRAAGYQESEIIVYNRGQNENTALTLDDMDTGYITDRANVLRAGRYYLNSRNIRQEIYSFTTDFEYLVCTVGDWVKLQHDVPLLGITSGRVSTAILENGQYTGIIVDEYIDMQANEDYVVLLRVVNEDTKEFELIELDLQATVADTTTTMLMFEHEYTPPTGITLDRGVLFAFCKRETGIEDLLITGISCGEDLSATLTCIKYDPAIYDVESDPSTYWDANIGLPASAAMNKGTTINSVEQELRDQLLHGVTSDIPAVPQVFVNRIPTPPYKVGDIWLNGNTILYAVNPSDSRFNIEDWSLAASDVYQYISRDNFGSETQSVQQRWTLYPVGDDYPLLVHHDYTVASGENNKLNVREDDMQSFWESLPGYGVLVVPTDDLGYSGKRVRGRTNADIVKVAGRYGRSAWLGPAFVNLFPSTNKLGAAEYAPEYQTTTNVSLTQGTTYVLQCSSGIQSLTCSDNYGTAYPEAPLVFVAEQTEDITVTKVSVDNELPEFIALTAIMDANGNPVIPPFTYNADGDSVQGEPSAEYIVGPTDAYGVRGEFRLSNKPWGHSTTDIIPTFYTLAEFVGSELSSSSIAIGLRNSLLADNSVADEGPALVVRVTDDQNGTEDYVLVLAQDLDSVVDENSSWLSFALELTDDNELRVEVQGFPVINIAIPELPYTETQVFVGARQDGTSWLYNEVNSNLEINYYTE